MLLQEQNILLSFFRMLDQLRTKILDLRRPNKTGIKIVVTDFEANIDEPPTPRSLQLLYTKFPQLQKVDHEFREAFKKYMQKIFGIFHMWDDTAF